MSHRQPVSTRKDSWNEGLNRLYGILGATWSLTASPAHGSCSPHLLDSYDGYVAVQASVPAFPSQFVVNLSSAEHHFLHTLRPSACRPVVHDDALEVRPCRAGSNTNVKPDFSTDQRGFLPFSSHPAACRQSWTWPQGGAAATLA